MGSIQCVTVRTLRLSLASKTHQLGIPRARRPIHFLNVFFIAFVHANNSSVFSTYGPLSSRVMVLNWPPPGIYIQELAKGELQKRPRKVTVKLIHCFMNGPCVVQTVDQQLAIKRGPIRQHAGYCCNHKGSSAMCFSIITMDAKWYTPLEFRILRFLVVSYQPLGRCMFNCTTLYNTHLHNRVSGSDARIGCSLKNFVPRIFSQKRSKASVP